MDNMKNRWYLPGLLVMLAFPCAAEASVPEIYGLGSRATALGGAFTAVADDFSAVYYNPAGLVMQRQPRYYYNNKGFRIEMGFMVAHPFFRAEGLDGRDLVLKLPGREAFPGGVIEPGEVWGLNLGIVFEPFDIGGLLPRKAFTIGLGLHVPFQRLYWWRPQFPEELHFIFHEDYSQRMIIQPAAAYQVTERLAIGAGVSILYTLWTNLYGPLNLRLSAFDPETMVFDAGGEDVYAGIDFDMKVDFAPIVGVLWKPTDFLQVGVTYRGEQFLHDYGTTDPILRVVLPGLPTEAIPGFAFGLDFAFAHYFTPHEVALGLRLKPLDRLHLSLDLTWMDWSDCLEVERSRYPEPEPRFEDTFVPRAGVEYELTPDMDLRLGYAYVPSPVPEQRRETNDLDSDRHIVSVGSEFLFGPVIASWHFQYQHMVTRTYRKASADDFYAPGLEFGGYIINAGLNISVGF